LKGDDECKQLILVTAEKPMQLKARVDYRLQYVVPYNALAAWFERREPIPDTVAKLQQWLQKVGV
jgi:hypothetical protein